MSKTVVVYWSGTGNTEAMAEYLVNAINEKGGQAELFPVDSFDVSTADAYDAFALGCSAWGSEELEANECLPVYEEIEPKLAGKKVLLFGSYGHGDAAYQQDWKARAEEAGAQVVATVGSLDAPEAEDEEALAAAADQLLA